jgi:hypothetical protein
MQLQRVGMTSIFTYRKSMGVRISFAVSCQLPNSLLSPQAANRSAICDGSSFTWNGQPTQDMVLGDVFFLQMYDADGSTIFKSRYFNLTNIDTANGRLSSIAVTPFFPPNTSSPPTAPASSAAYHPPPPSPDTT